MYFKLLFLLILSQVALASPWMTGPLLAPAGKTIQPKHFNFEPYFFYTIYPGNFRNIEGVPVLTVGITHFLDLQTSVPYDVSWHNGQRGNGFGDYNFGFGLQALRQKENSWIPDLRITVQEIFPTGKFDHLDSSKLGTDQTGVGSYQTYLGFNFQKLNALRDDQYLRTRLSLVTAFASDVKVSGVNTFGGSSTTDGKIKLGNSYSVDLAFEYALDQHWVPVFEVLYVNSDATNFTGSPGFTPGGTFASIGSAGGHQASLAPAMEYNFSENLGIIVGVWFSVTGPRAAEFVSNTVALNYYF